MSEPPQNPPDLSGADETQTGLPLLRTWRAVYIAVTLIFFVYVALLTLLPRVYR